MRKKRENNKRLLTVNMRSALTTDLHHHAPRPPIHTNTTPILPQYYPNTTPNFTYRPIYDLKHHVESDPVENHIKNH